MARTVPQAAASLTDERLRRPAKAWEGSQKGVTGEARPGMGERALPWRGSRDIVAQVRNAILARPLRADVGGPKASTACHRLCAAWGRLRWSYGMFLPAASSGARPPADAAGEAVAACLLPRVSGRRLSVRR